MKWLLVISLLAMFPAAAVYADHSFPQVDDAWVNELLEKAKAGMPAQPGGVYVESHSSVSTGGQVVTGGQTVSTGASSASSHVQTVINSSNDGGSVEVRVETERDGDTQVREYADTLTPGEGVHVEASAVVTPEKTDIGVRVNGEEVAPLAASSAPAAAVLGAAAEADAEIETGAPGLFAAVPAFFKKLLDFLPWF